MDTARTGLFGVSPARITAYAALLFLCGVITWNMTAKPDVVASNTPTRAAESVGQDYLATLASSTSENSTGTITPLGASIFANAVLAYDRAATAASSSDAGLAAVQKLGESIVAPVAFRTYAASDIKTDPDTSKDRALSYRADLRVALEPLFANKDYELDIFAKYIDTKDPTYLNQMHATSQNYKLAIANTEKVVAPADAASYQAAILSAMNKFSATLDALAAHAEDPFASAALLRTYIDAQDGVVASFNSIGRYAAQKLL